MNVQNEIDAINRQAKKLQDRVFWLESNRTTLEQLPEGAFFYSSSGVDWLDFDNLSHEQVIEVIKTIGGKWDKELSSPDSGDRINYKGELNGQLVRCYAGGPPPNCKVVEWEEEIPAQKIQRRKLVCGNEPEAEQVPV